ncbi:beta-galactosidase GalA [Sphingomonas hengshuiensis]|uniref:beta-galactosidase GalA n=1 Tax=Sphingomonas hengshuiensis TaxID=1609977 RepID=UPI000696E768|nr:beta-galactosidase GalA [Sphingomonas hengshuiensis]
MDVTRRTLMAGAAGAVASPAMASWQGASAARSEEPLLDGLMPLDALPDPLEVEEPGCIRVGTGWRFHEGDSAMASLRTHDETYLAAKAGAARGAAAIDYDDSAWPVVDLPHDWAIRQPFDRNANVDQGYKPRGIGWYRRSFTLDDGDRGRKLELRFGGIATHATIWVNGSVVARNWSGYNAIAVDITPFARFGPDEPNIVAVRVDAEAMEGWWYEGAGLYRHVTLAKRPAVSILTDGVHCDPRHDGDDRWRVPVTATLENIGDASQRVTVAAVLRDPEGREVARGERSGAIGPLARAELALTLSLRAPARWSPEHPTLYRLEVTATSSAGVDTRRIAIGFRTIRFDAERGFFLNEQPVKLKGVCLHQDHAGVGTAVPDSLLEWRLRRMKDVGVNAIRCTHNAQADAFYALCDRMGFLVMDENRQFNPAPDHLAELEWLVRAHRNHPSIILWSVFNEEPMQGTRAGREMVRRMAAAVRMLDDSRPITAAMNGGLYAPENVSQAIDVMGFNYQTGEYDKFHASNPRLPSTSSEDTSAFMTRGAYRTDRAAHVMSSMDDEAADWGATHRNAWAMIAERPYLAGGFVWTGFDYHGEPTPFEWPTISSFFGILDLCGFAKTAYDIRRAQWIDHRPVIGIAPHWTWPGRNGEMLDILVTSNVERVRLMLNGTLVGEQACDRVRGCAFKLAYAPGEITAIGLRGGSEVVRTAHRTAGPPVALRLLPARMVMRADGEDLIPVTIHAVDAAGRHVPIAQHAVTLRIAGGAIAGLGNGDPNSHEPAQGDRRSLFNGLAQALVRAGPGGKRLVLTASASGLADGNTAIRLV